MPRATMPSCESQSPRRGALALRRRCHAQSVAEAPAFYLMHANVHDEVQFSCDEKDAPLLGDLFVKAITKAGDDLNFKCPLDGEYKVGNNWKDTH